MTVIRKIADFFLATYLFIASASGCLVLSTFFITGSRQHIIPLTGFVFFSTLLIYNFHKVSTDFGEKVFSISFFIQQLKKITGSTKTMMVIAMFGLLLTAPFLKFKTFLLFLPLAMLTYAYTIPVLSTGNKKKRLREIFLAKITTLALVWSFSTVTIPLEDNGFDLFSASALSLFTQRFLFMFAICVPFEIRDMEQEKKWGNTTLPLLLGESKSKTIGIIALLLFSLLVYFEFSSRQLTTVALPLYLSAVVAALLILFSDRRRSQYYFRLFVDGTIQLQFILLLLFSLLA